MQFKTASTVVAQQVDDGVAAIRARPKNDEEWQRVSGARKLVAITRTLSQTCDPAVATALGTFTFLVVQMILMLNCPLFAQQIGPTAAKNVPPIMSIWIAMFIPHGA